MKKLSLLVLLVVVFCLSSCDSSIKDAELDNFEQQSSILSDNNETGSMPSDNDGQYNTSGEIIKQEDINNDKGNIELFGQIMVVKYVESSCDKDMQNIEGATVELSNGKNFYTATSNKDGCYSIKDIKQGIYICWVFSGLKRYYSHTVAPDG